MIIPFVAEMKNFSFFFLAYGAGHFLKGYKTNVTLKFSTVIERKEGRGTTSLSRRDIQTSKINFHKSDRAHEFMSSAILRWHIPEPPKIRV